MEDEIRSVLSGLVGRASRIAGHLNAELFLPVLGMHLEDKAVQQLWKILSCLPAAAIDLVLEGLAEDEDRRQCLRVISQGGATPTRIRAFQKDLREGLQHGDMHPDHAKIAEMMWCEEVAQVVVDAIADAIWNPECGTIFALALERSVAKQMTHELASKFVAPALNRPMSPESREMLEFWADTPHFAPTRP